MLGTCIQHGCDMALLSTQNHGVATSTLPTTRRRVALYVRRTILARFGVHATDRVWILQLCWGRGTATLTHRTISGEHT